VKEFNANDYLKHFAPEKPFFFWHGQSIHYSVGEDGIIETIYGGDENADRVAKENKGMTLRMCLLANRGVFEKAGVRFIERPNEDGSIFTDIEYGDTVEELDGFWKSCSAAFAQNARGKIYCIEGDEMRPGGRKPHQPYDMHEHEHDNNFNAIELPIMMLLKKVNSVVLLSPKGDEKGEVTLEEECLKVHHKVLERNDIINYLYVYLDNITVKTFLEKLESERLKSMAITARQKSQDLFK